MRRALLIAAAAAAFALGGCVSLLPKSEPAQLYQFGAGRGGEGEAPAAPAAGGPVGRDGGAPGVVLAQVSLPRPALGDGILTVKGDEAAYIAGARWLAPAVVLFEEAAERTLRARVRTVRLVDRTLAGAASVSLRLDVDEFDVRYPAGGASAPTVAVSLHATLARADGRALLQQDFAARRPAGADRVGAIVEAYDGVTAAVLAEVADWTDARAPALARDLDPSTPRPLLPRHPVRGLDASAPSR